MGALQLWQQSPGTTPEWAHCPDALLAAHLRVGLGWTGALGEGGPVGVSRCSVFMACPQDGVNWGPAHPALKQGLMALPSQGARAHASAALCLSSCLGH